MSIPTRLFVVEKSQISAAVAEALAERSIVESNDPRLSDARTPTDGSVTNAKVAANAAIAESKLSLASDAAAATASRRTLGTGATQAAAGNDSRLSNARTPTAHGHPATEIANTPAGNIAATTVQAAINELDTEKQPAGSYAPNAHDHDSRYYTETESDGRFKPIGYIPAFADITGKPSVYPPDIGSGANQAVAGNDPRLSDARTPTTHAHAASQITSTATGDVAATTVQAAIAELAAEKVPTSRTVSSGAGLTGGGDLSENRTLGLADTTVSPGSYTNANITVDQQGRITSAGNGQAGSGGSGSATTATDTAQGIVELATATEVQNGTSGVLVATAAILKAELDRRAGGYVASNDARLTDARTPTAHKGTHATGGSDALSPADIGAATSGHSHPATAISYAGSTNLSATNVEAALDELDAEKQPAGSYASATHTHEKDYPPFGFADALTVRVNPHAYLVREARTVTEVWATLGTASTSGGITLSVRRNGTQVATVTVAQGATSGVASGLSVALSVGNTITAACTAAGTGAKDAAVAMRAG